MQKLTWSSAPLVNRGQQARWHAEIYVIFRGVNLCHYKPVKLRGRRKYPSGYPHKHFFAIYQTQSTLAYRN